MKTEIRSFTPGPWRLELIQTWPFGFKITAGEHEIMAQTAYCSATGQKTREDCERGVGFGHKDPTSRDEAIRLNAEQDANARLIAAAPAMYEALRNLAAVHECWCGPLGTRICYRCRALAVLAEVEE